MTDSQRIQALELLKEGRAVISRIEKELNFIAETLTKHSNPKRN